MIYNMYQKNSTNREIQNIFLTNGWKNISIAKLTAVNGIITVMLLTSVPWIFLGLISNFLLFDLVWHLILAETNL